MEEVARQQYVSCQEQRGHCNLKTEKTGLVISTDNPWLAASPDDKVHDPIYGHTPCQSAFRTYSCTGINFRGWKFQICVGSIMFTDTVTSIATALTSVEKKKKKKLVTLM